MARGDREKWDARHPVRSPGEPSPWVLSVTERLLPRHGRALDVAGGGGKYAVVLARHGLDVTVADVSPVGLQMAAEAARAEGLAVKTAAMDLEERGLPAGPWDVIFCAHFLDRPLYRTFVPALAPGGWLLIVHMTRENLKRNAHPTAQFLLEPGELPTLLDGVVIESYEEGWADGRHEARLVGRSSLSGARNGATPLS